MNYISIRPLPLIDDISIRLLPSIENISIRPLPIIDNISMRPVASTDNIRPLLSLIISQSVLSLLQIMSLNILSLL